MSRVINWFEIPAADFERARRFYEAVFAVSLKLEEMSGMNMGVFPYGGEATGGAIVQGPQMKPAAGGVVIYLNGGDDLALPLSRVAPAGGQVLMPKTLLSAEIGSIALFQDSEGNVIGLHSR